MTRRSAAGTSLTQPEASQVEAHLHHRPDYGYLSLGEASAVGRLWFDRSAWSCAFRAVRADRASRHGVPTVGNSRGGAEESLQERLQLLNPSANARHLGSTNQASAMPAMSALPAAPTLQQWPI